MHCWNMRGLCITMGVIPTLITRYGCIQYAFKSKVTLYPHFHYFISNPMCWSDAVSTTVQIRTDCTVNYQRNKYLRFSWCINAMNTIELRMKYKHCMDFFQYNLWTLQGDLSSSAVFLLVDLDTVKFTRQQILCWRTPAAAQETTSVSISFCSIHWW